jgi:hypothetical protein
MVSTLIQDGITISSKNDCNFGKFEMGDNDRKTDKRTFESKSIKHNYYIDKSKNIATLEEIRSDSFKHQDTNSLFNKSESVILDIDLDFFTYACEGTFSKNPLDIRIQISSESFHALFEKSKIVTIALEPFWCGGNVQCINILEIFDLFFFRPKGLDIVNTVISELLMEDKENYDFIIQICEDSKKYLI